MYRDISFSVMYLLLFVFGLFSYELVFPKFKKIKKCDISISFRRNFEKIKNIDINCTGDINNLFYNIKLASHNYEFGMSGLKKSGEEFKFDINTMRFFFNTNSIYFVVKNINLSKILIKKFIFGNFKIGYGQGLVFNYKEDNFYKPLGQMKIFRKQSGIVKCVSHKKNKFFGCGIEFEYRKLEGVFFISRNYFDGILRDGYIYSAKTRENYIDTNKIDRKNKIFDSSIGFVLVAKPSKIINFGITFIFSKFNRHFKLVNNSNFNDNQLSNMDNLFTGNKNMNVGIFSNLSYKKVKLYVETAISTNGFKSKSNFGYGSILGFRVKINKNIKYVNLFRIYSSKYHNFYGKGFGTAKGLVFKKFKGCLNNEIGIYNGLQVKLTDKFIYKLGIDFAYIPNKTFTFTKAFIEYVDCELIYNFNIYDYIKLQCKYINTEYDIMEKTLNFFNFVKDNCRLKFTISKKILRIFSKTNIFLTINPNEICKYIFGFGIYEKISTRIKNLTINLHFIAMIPSKKNSIYMYSKFSNTRKWKLKIFNKKTIKTGISLDLKIKIINFEILYLLKYDIEDCKMNNILYLSMNYIGY